MDGAGVKEAACDRNWRRHNADLVVVLYALVTMDCSGVRIFSKGA